MNFLLSALSFVLSIVSLPAIAVEALTLSPAIDLATVVNTQQSVAFYNPSSQTIMSPVPNTNEIVMVPWKSYNSSMLWNVVSESPYSSAYYVYSANSLTAGCAEGDTSQWISGQDTPLVNDCGSYISANQDQIYDDYLFTPSIKPNTYIIAPFANYLACVTIVNGAPVIPGAPCSGFFTTTNQWRMVTIS